MKPLEGIRILDLSRFLAGPYGTELLAQMGAEVIRIERPGGELDRNMGIPVGDTMWAFFFLHTACNKKCITLDLQTEKGREILKELVKESDVLLHNFTPDIAKSVGLEYETFKEINPKIIFAALTGFGQTGPHKNRTAFDVIMQAISGAMSITGFPDKPPGRAVVSYVDLGTGMLTALGIMIALYNRQQTGKGQMVDTALIDAATSFIASHGIVSEYKLFQSHRLRIGNNSFWGLTDCFKSKDGWIFIYVPFDHFWKKFAKTIGREDLLDDPRFETDYLRFTNRHIICPIINEWTADKTTAEIVLILEKIRLPCGPVNTIADLIEDPQVKEREMLTEIEYPGIGMLTESGVPIKLSETPGSIDTRPPLLGEQNDEIYSSLLGYSAEQLKQLRDEKVI
ncbi:CaiB/BaiF CoA transferase family protein [Chloroflexota bacterium]